MDVKFIGTGSAFNTKLYNNSCYIKNNNSLILIDCGGTTFTRLQEKCILDNIKNLDIIITHTHPDHVGSLGDLIFYAYYILKIKPNIYFPDKNLLCSFFMSIGVNSEFYNLISNNNFNINNSNFNVNINFISVNHVKNLPSYGFIIESEDDAFYYSGDSNNIDDSIIKKLHDGKLKRIYHDTCKLDYADNPHTSLKKLKEKIPEDLRSKVYCMHIDTELTTLEIKENGFNEAHL